MIQYKIIKLNDSALHEMGKDNWNLNCIFEGKMYFSRKKEKKSMELVKVSKTQEFFTIIGNDDTRNEFCESYNLDQERLKEFYLYWTEKSENAIKCRWEKEKVFDIKLRLYTWFKRNKFTSNNNKVGIL